MNTREKNDYLVGLSDLFTEIFGENIVFVEASKETENEKCDGICDLCSEFDLCYPDEDCESNCEDCDHYDEYCGNEEEVNFVGELIIEPEKVIFNKPATIVYWSDKTRTVVKCQKGDKFDAEKGLAMAVLKKLGGNDGSYNRFFDYWMKHAIVERR